MMEEKLKADMGGAYHLTDEDLIAGHAAHDFDGNGLITKDEVLWSRKMKSAFYKAGVLTDALAEIFEEDLNMYLKLPNEV